MAKPATPASAYEGNANQTALLNTGRRASLYLRPKFSHHLPQKAACQFGDFGSIEIRFRYQPLIT